MLLCFGSRRGVRHQPNQWSEKDFLLEDEPQIIPDPFFLYTGTVSIVSSTAYEDEIHPVKRAEILLAILYKSIIKVSLIVNMHSMCGYCTF